MDSALLEAAKQVPALVVLVAVVIVFLRFLRAEGDTARAFIADQNAQTREAMRHHANAMDRFGGQMAALTDAVVRNDAVLRIHDGRRS